MCNLRESNKTFHIICVFIIKSVTAKSLSGCLQNRFLFDILHAFVSLPHSAIFLPIFDDVKRTFVVREINTQELTNLRI